MRSISNYALGLPEILVNVLQHLVDEHEILDARSLFACLQVSKLWFEEATTVLWSDEPPIQALAAPLKDPQFFANKILALKVDLKDCTTKSVLSRFRFPRLVEVDFQSSEAEDDNQPVLQCLQPRLKILRFNQGSLSDDFLTELMARCPRLESLFLSSASTQITSGGLLRFLRLTPSVTCFVFNIAWDFVMSDEIYVHLASRASLERIGLPDRSLTTTAADRILASIVHPFEKLDSIQCTANNDAFDQLIPHLTNLDDLCVSLLDRSDSVIFNLSKCANLTSLGISMDSELPRCPPAALLAISRRCTSLWNFSINIDSKLDNPPGRDGEFNDDFIQNFTSTLPKLEQIVFDIRDNSLTAECLRYLGRNCPRLVTTAMTSALHLPDLGQSGPPALPLLDHLELERLSLGTGSPDQELKDVVDTLYHHVPKLEILSTDHRQSFCRLVMEKLKALRKERGTEQVQRIV